MASAPTAAEGTPAPRHYRFDGIVVDTAAHELRRDGQPKALEPKAFAVLMELLAHPGELVSRDHLLDLVWGHRHVTPGVLTRAIAQLRTAMEDDSHHPRFIQTRHGLGYCFIGELEVQPGKPPIAVLADDVANSTTPALKPLAIAVEDPAGAKPERRSADRIAHRRWLLLAVLLGLVLVLVLAAMLSQPGIAAGAPGPRAQGGA